MSTLPLNNSYLPTASYLRDRGETARVAFVPELTPEAVGPVVSALLNGEGGTIVAGTGETALAGNTGDVRTWLFQELSRRLAPSAPLSISVDTSLSKPCLLVEVPAGSNPPYVYNGMIFLRKGVELRRATARDITALISRPQSEPTRWEQQAAVGLDPEDLDSSEIEKTLLDTRARDPFSRSQDRFGSNMDMLEILSLASSGVIHNAAAALFGQNPAVAMPQTRVRAAVRYSDAPGDFADSRVFEGNAFRLFDDMLEFVRRHVSVASTLPENEVVRVDTPDLPLSALREGLLNALVHRDYSASDGGISLLIFPDRIEIWNSGILPSGLSVKDLSEGAGVSRPRNPDIANIFFLRGLIERWGLGTQRIVHACREAGLPPPEWTEIGGGVRLVLRRVLTSNDRKTAQLIGSRLSSSASGVPDRAALFLENLPRKPTFDANDYKTFLAQFGFAVSERTMRNDLVQLVKSELIERLGTTSGTYYRRL